MSSPVNSLVETPTEFQEGHFIDARNFAFVVFGGEVFPSNSDVTCGFGQHFGDDLVEKGQALENLGRVGNLFIDEAGQIRKRKFGSILEIDFDVRLATRNFDRWNSRNTFSAPSDCTAWISAFRASMYR